MKTAIVSDLHLGLASGRDVVRDPEIRAALCEELRSAERVVLLGDIVELRERPLGAALDQALPFFVELGAALGDVEVVLVPGNHDARLAEPLLDRLSLEDAPLPLAATADPTPGPTATIAAALSPARLRIGYPGIWLRDDVYATHGHYMDLHLRLPRAECVMLAAVTRLVGPLPDPAGPADYERIVRPVYGLAYGAAQGQSRRLRRADRGPSEAAWELIAGDRPDRTRTRRLKARAARASFPLAVAGVNRLFRAEFESEISAEAISRSGIEGATELAHRLAVDGAHVITGHTHRAGPRADETPWRLPGGGHLHNTGNWVFTNVMHRPGRPPNSYWPGTVTWVEDSGPPRQVELLRDREHTDLLALAARSRGSDR
ncbi:MAG TPA: metallophosphoesterase [Solirubrobacterales bacterium]|jgi:UDP-2,3-diacylglucosamine pyrophosphatase LpxH|nr:metallophosphoesterase [Solirubrobacterales bacterium]